MVRTHKKIRGSLRPRSDMPFAAEVLELRVLLNAPGTGWKLVFDDEFNGASVDTSKWNIASPGWTMPNSASTASASMVSEGNGVLTLSATRNADGSFTSGSISGYQKYTFSGGYVEARIKLPSTPGSWPAFWGLYTGWPPEADIMEYPLTTDGGTSGLPNNEYNTNYHYTNSSGQAAAGAGPVNAGYDLRGNWHTFGMKWVPNTSMTFYLDGNPVSSYTGSSVSQMVNMYMILDYAVGGWPGTPSTSQWPVGFTDQMNVDWVHVYQYTASASPAIANAGFNTTGSWTFTDSNAFIVTGGTIGHTGSGDLHIQGAGEADQTITGLSPNTTYTVTGDAIIGTGSTPGLIGVRYFSGGGGNASANVGSVGSWAQGSVTFTTGPSDTSAQIYCNNPNSNYVYFDDLALTTPTLLNPVANATTTENRPLTIPVSAIEGQSGDFWNVTASSSNPALVSNSDFTHGGSGSSRSLTINPEPGASGTTTVTLTATDALGTTSTQTFNVTVTIPPASNVSFSPVGTGAYAAGDVNSCAIATDNLITDVRSGFQFVAYYDSLGHIIIGRRTVGSSSWQTFDSGLAVPTGDLGDDHNVIAIAVDSAGFMHMSWDMHNVALKYAISNAPVTGATLSGLAFTQQTEAVAPSLFPDAGATTNEVTYPQFYNIPNSNSLLFVYRNGGAGGGSGNGDEYFDVYSPASKTWTNNLVINGEQTSVNAYLNRLAFDPNGTLLMSWTWRATPNWQTNSNILFAQSPDDGTTWYEQGGGTQYTLPIIQSGSPASSVAQVIETIPQNSSFINQTSMTVNANGNPIIATWLDPSSTNPNRQYVLYYYQNGQWRSSQISTRTSDTSIDSSGADVRDLGRPIVLVDKEGRVLVVTRSEDSAMGSYANPATPNNDIVVSYCSDLSAANPTWNSVTLDTTNMGAWEPTYDSALWASQNKLSLVFEPVGLAGESPSAIQTLDWDEQAFFGPPISNGSFETPALTTYQYDPTDAGWAFAGNAGIEHNGSAFNAASAPDGVQAAFLQSNVTANQKAIGSISQTINLSAGQYTISVEAAQRTGKTALPIAVSIDGVQVGNAITPSSTAWSTYTTDPFTVSAGSHTISFTGVDASTLDTDSFIDAVSIAPTPPSLVGAPVINGDNPNGLFNAAGQPTPGVQRSMVEDIVYTFSEPVTIPDAKAAFSVVGTGPHAGTAPATLMATAVPGSNGTQWAVSLTGKPVDTLASIANGEYSITINPNAVFAPADGVTAMTTGETDTFFRLFGDINGDRVVNVSDEFQFSKALNAYTPIFDVNGDGTVNLADEFQASRSFSSGGYVGDGFVTTI
jgi:beta-glucanase (GH16 family)